MKQVLTILLFTSLYSLNIIAQPVMSPRNMALGGGGSTYITDYHANFYNPANLMIQDRETRFSIGIGIPAIFFNGMQNSENPKKQLDHFRNHLDPYDSAPAPFSNKERLSILEDNYPGNRTLSMNKGRYDITLFGLNWLRDDKVFSFALRTRTSSSFNVGKGWYTSVFEENSDNKNVVDRSLIHRYQSLHEISFGYAESFRFLTNLTSRIDNFIIGIAPKLVLGSDYQNGKWENIYEQNVENGSINRIQNFDYNASGQFGEAATSYLSGTPITQANEAFSTTSFDINGIGAGLDIGITYLITLGDDLSAVQKNEQTQRSLRLSFSMTDIGIISYNKSNIELKSPTDTTFSSSVPNELSDQLFSGSKGQYIDFIERFGKDNPFLVTPANESTFAVLLPMAMHAGALLEINRIKLMGDLSIGLTNNAFNTTRLTTSLGIELRPFSVLPIRGGLRLEGQRPEYVSIGTAIETKNWNLSLAGLFLPNSFTETPKPVGAAAATLQFHF
ncbi:DUF5723 family protein [Gracilimonas sp.]|uniref:DUF5723 family protein n=1 Tax=Gracilimonas sp. TaxID=1974203 RepID=UPI002871C88B|nr:DUF5723 family protein [Gracilimonas sp.]